MVGQKRVRTAADDSPVPVASNAEARAREQTNLLAQLTLEDTWMYQPAFDDFIKQALGLALRLDELLGNRIHEYFLAYSVRS